MRRPSASAGVHRSLTAVLCIGGVFGLLLLLVRPGSAHAIQNGSLAVDVLGQTDAELDAPGPIFTKGAQNDAPNRLGYRSLEYRGAYPQGVAVDSTRHRLFVEAGHSRVLVYTLKADNTLEDRVPDSVLGQGTFYQGSPLGSAPTQSSFGGARGGLAYDTVRDRLFFADSLNHRVLVFDVSTIDNGENAVAVLGQTDFTTGTTGTTQATTNKPVGLAVDADGNRLFVADTGNNRVLVFDVSAIDNGENASAVLGQASYTTATAAISQAGMSDPMGLAVDADGNRLFVADTGNNRVLVFDVGTITNGENAGAVLGQASYATNAAGTTQATMNKPVGLAVDTTKNRLFVADLVNNRVLVFDVGTITNGENAVAVLGQSSFATNTAATTRAGMRNSSGLAIDDAGAGLFVADSSNFRILVFDVGTIVNGEDAVDVLGQTDGILSPPGPVFTKNLTDDAPNRLGLFASGNIAGVGLYAREHHLFVADMQNNRVLVYNLKADNTLADRIPDKVLGQDNFFSREPSAPTPLQRRTAGPAGLALDENTGRLFVADSLNNRVLVFNVTTITNGENAVSVLGQSSFTTNAGATTQAGMNLPRGLAFDAAGKRLFVADSQNNRILVFDINAITNGENAIAVLGQPSYATRTAATSQAGMESPDAVAVDTTNTRLFVADRLNHRVLVFDVSQMTNGEDATHVLGQAAFTTKEPATAQDRMNFPSGVTVDAASDRLFVAEGNRVLAFDVKTITNGEGATHVLGQADFTSNARQTTQEGMSLPSGLAFDAANGYLVVHDSGNNRVTLYDAAPPADLVTIHPTTTDLALERSVAKPQPGDAVTWRFRARNQGGTAAEPSTARVCIDNVNCQRTAAGQLSVHAVDSLGPGAVSPTTYTSSPWTATNGVHTVSVCQDVNGDGGVPEFSREANNCTSDELRIATGPDLVTVLPDGASRYRSTENPIAGNTVTFSFRAKNQGDEPAAASTARVCIDNADCQTTTTGEIGTPAVLSLGAGAASAVLSVDWTAEVGQHTVRICQDVSGGGGTSAVEESDETNNCAEETFDVTGTVDLRVTALTVKPAAPSAGQQLTVDATIENRGSLQSVPSVARLSVDANNDGTFETDVSPDQNIRALSKDETQGAQWKDKVTAAAPRMGFRVCADAADDNPNEESEANNCLTTTRRVSGQFRPGKFREAPP